MMLDSFYETVVLTVGFEMALFQIEVTFNLLAFPNVSVYFLWYHVIDYPYLLP